MSGSVENKDFLESLRARGVERLRANDLEGAIALFDQIIDAQGCDEDLRELASIDKAFALIMLERDGREVRDLPKIVLQRRNPKHVVLAARNLVVKYRLSNNLERARFYGAVALEHIDAAEAEWKPGILVSVGNLALFDSDFVEALQRYEDALQVLDPKDVLIRALLFQNAGYCKLQMKETQAGIRLIHDAIQEWQHSGAEGFLAESYIDLCLGYLELDELGDARRYGEMGLELATEDRQIRNAHYLLGEVAYKLGDIAAAEEHFEVLSSSYPEFPYLKDLLLAIDLRSMVNWKLS